MSDNRSLVSSIVDESAGFGVSLTRSQQEKLAHYRDLLLAWNDRFNLTAIRDPVQVEERLFLDALRMLPAIRCRIGEEMDAPRLVDVGSGAGFPGMVLAIACPSWHVTLIEATGKKVRFLAHVVEELGLPQVSPVHARAEDIGHNAVYRDAFDVAVARAVASLPALLELCAPLLRSGGVAFFPKSTNIDDELAAGRSAAPMVGMKVGDDRILPASTTRLVTAIKTNETPARYPRRSGIPAREPLHGVVPAKSAIRGGTR